MTATTRIKGRPWQRIRRAVLNAEPCCVVCLADNRVTLATEVDHILPIHKGGGNEIENLQPLCSECHAFKTYVDLNGRPKPKPVRSADW